MSTDDHNPYGPADGSSAADHPPTPPTGTPVPAHTPASPVPPSSPVPPAYPGLPVGSVGSPHPTPADPVTPYPVSPFGPPVPADESRGGGTGWTPPPPTPPAGWFPAGGQWTPPPAAAPTPRTRGHHRLRNVAVGSVAVVVALGVGIGIGRLGRPADRGSFPSISASGPGSTGSAPSSGAGNSGGFGGSGGLGGSGGSGGSSGSSGSSAGSGVAAQVDPGLVDINTSLGYQSGEAAGTGMVISSSGVVLTNNHVIDGATTINATDVGNGRTYSATVIGYDRTQDIAVVQLKNASGLQTVTLGDSSSVSVGASVDGIGNAGGTGGTPSDASGSVTALGQDIAASDVGDGNSEQLTGLIQTNANIQPGDSGGPLVNGNGQVVGIDTAASSGFNLSSSSSNGYAIPIDRAISIARGIMAGGASSTVHIGPTAFLGVQVESGSSSSDAGGQGFGGQGFGGSAAPTVSGATVAGVVSGGSADQAGLVQGDVITSLDGHAITTPTDLTTLMEQERPGDTVRIGWVDQSGQSHSATAQLQSGPPS